MSSAVLLLHTLLIISSVITCNSFGLFSLSSSRTMSLLLSSSMRTLSLVSSSSFKTLNNEIIHVGGTDNLLQYKYFKLNNDIPVILIHDGASEKSSASLGVSAGASYDPIPGMAHFTEHCVFLGSTKYPIENAYKDFLNKNGGSSNAATGMEYTLYKFQVNSQQFKHSLDIFSQFFKNPSFTSSAIGREVMAVDAEDSKNRILDNRRYLQVVKSLIVDLSSYRKFSTGNCRTIADGDAVGNSEHVTAMMKAFHRKYYRPENMALVLVGPQSINELTQLSIEMFSDITSADDTLSTTNSKGDKYTHDIGDKDDDVSSKFSSSSSYPFTTGGLYIQMKPIKDIRSVSMLFGVPSTRKRPNNDPLALLRYIISSNKGDGSVFQLLQQRGWSTGISTDEFAEFQNDFSIFEVSISLTEEGLVNIDKVIDIIYTYISMIDNMSSIQLNELWDDLRNINLLNFKFQSKSSVYELSNSIARSMLFNDIKDVFSAGYMLDDKLNIDTFKQYVRLLTPTRSVTIVRSKSFDEIPDDKEDIEAATTTATTAATTTTATATASSIHDKGILKEKWYGVSYNLEKRYGYESCSSHVINISDAYKSVLNLPPKNAYINSRLVSSLSAAAADTEEHIEDAVNADTTGTVGTGRRLHSSPPVLIDENLYHSLDEVFHQPKSCVTSLIHLPISSHPLNSLVSSVFDQSIVSKYNAAAIAGLQYSLSTGIRGIQLTVNGFSDQTESAADSRLMVLGKSVLTDYYNPSFWKDADIKLFTNCKERLIRSLKSWSKERPDSQADSLINFVLAEHSWLPTTRLMAAEDITHDGFLAYITSLIHTKCGVTTYGHGNILDDRIKSYQKNIVTIANMNDASASSAVSTTMTASRARLLDRNVKIAMKVFNSEEDNSAVVMHIQCASLKPKVSALLLVIRRLLSEPLFSELRTKKQLGYIVSMDSGSIGRGLQAMRSISIRVLSKNYSPIAINQEIDTFLSNQKHRFDTNLTQDAITNLAASIVKSLRDPPTDYTEEMRDYWSSIIEDIPVNWNELVIAELESLTLHDVLSHADEWIFNEHTRKSVSCLLFGRICTDYDSIAAAASGRDDILTSFEEIEQERDRLKYFET